VHIYDDEGYIPPANNLPLGPSNCHVVADDDHFDAVSFLWMKSGIAFFREAEVQNIACIIAC
jgi:hypothetical protein